MLLWIFPVRPEPYSADGRSSSRSKTKLLNTLFVTYLLAIVGLSALGVLADSIIKLSSQHSPPHVGWLALGALLYGLCAPGWLFVMRRVSLSGIGASYAGVSLLLLVAVGVFVFNERLSATEIVGVVFALLAVASLYRLL